MIIFIPDSQSTEFARLKELYLKYENDIAKDNAPEIRTRLSHIKLIFLDK